MCARGEREQRIDALWLAYESGLLKNRPGSAHTLSQKVLPRLATLEMTSSKTYATTKPGPAAARMRLYTTEDTAPLLRASVLTSVP